MKVGEEQNFIDKILTDIVVYLTPTMLKPGYELVHKGKHSKEKKWDEYFTAISHIKYFLDKVLKYDIYFEEFYPDSKNIKPHEALEYHIYSYFEDIDILRNKLSSFLGLLKNDLKTNALNKKEINDALVQFIEKIDNSFRQLKDKRHPHHHSGPRFLDSNVTKSESLNIILQYSEKFGYLIDDEEIKNKARETFNEAKKSWVDLAKKNQNQLRGIVNAVFEKNYSYILLVLDIVSVDKNIIKKQD